MRGAGTTDACAARVLLVQHGVVYQDCDGSGRWVTLKNTSECDLTDSSPVRGGAAVTDVAECVEEKARG